MILTVTPNTALDRVAFLPHLRRNARNQATEWTEWMGGKGCNVSLILAEMGEASVATGLAAGDSGARMDAMLRAADVTSAFVWTEGETRMNTVIVETGTGDHTTLCAESIAPDRHALPGLLSWVEQWSGMSAATVIAGSLPEAWPTSVYSELVSTARRAGKPVIVDASGTQLEAALDVGVSAVKPNRHELGSVAGPLSDRASVLAAAQALQRRGAGWVLASLGDEGAILVSERGAWSAPALPVQVVNPSGAGDGMTACLALGLTRGWDEVETLRWAVAVSGAIVGTRGTAEVARAAIDDLIPAVRVECM